MKDEERDEGRCCCSVLLLLLPTSSWLVTCLEIPVDDSPEMAVLEASQQLLEVKSSNVFGKRTARKGERKRKKERNEGRRKERKERRAA